MRRRTISEMADHSTRASVASDVRAQKAKLSLGSQNRRERERERERSRGASKTFGCRRLHVFSIPRQGPSSKLTRGCVIPASAHAIPVRDGARPPQRPGAKLSPHVEFVEWEHQREEAKPREGAQLVTKFLNGFPFILPSFSSLFSLLPHGPWQLPLPPSPSLLSRVQKIR